MRTYKRNRAPILIALTLLGAGAACGGFFLVRRHARAVACRRPRFPSLSRPAADATVDALRPPGRRAPRRGPHRVAPMHVPTKKELAAA